MPRATPLLLLLLLVAAARAADVFVIADSANQTAAVAAAAQQTIAAANELAANATLDELAPAGNDTDADPVVRKKRTFGDIVFRGLADVLGYNVARKAPQVVFPPPLAPVPGIDTPLPAQAARAQDAPLQIPFAIVPLQPAAQAAPAPCGRAAAPQPCAPPPAPAPKPKAAPPPCPKPRALPKPKPKPKPKPPPPPPPCGSGRANPTTAAPCGAAPHPKADSNLETVSSNFRLDFNFNRNPAGSAALTQEVAAEQPAEEAPQDAQREDEPAAPVVAIRPQAAALPPEPPRSPRVYLDAYVVQNGVTQRIQTVDATAGAQHQPDNDFLAYDDLADAPAPPEPVAPTPPQQQALPPAPEPPAQDDDYDYVQDTSERSKSVREFGAAVDQFWDGKKNKKKKVPAYDYRAVHFGDRDFADQLRERSASERDTHQALQQAPAAPPAEDEEEEATTTTQNPRRRLKPRVLPPTEKNPNQIDTITVRVPPIYKEKRPRKLHREPQTEAPVSSDSDDDVPYKPYEYSYPGSDGNGFYTGFSGPYSSEQYRHSSDANSENSESTYQTERPQRKRRRKSKRRTRSLHSQQYTAGDYDYYGKKLPISQEEEYFRGLTIPPPTADADLLRRERAHEGDGHFLDDHERLRDDPERIKSKQKANDKKQAADEAESADEAETTDEADESERSGSAERSSEAQRSGSAERSGERERADESERSDRLGPNARVRETGYKNNYVHAHNVQVEDAQPLVRAVRRKKPARA